MNFCPDCSSGCMQIGGVHTAPSEKSLGSDSVLGGGRTVRQRVLQAEIVQEGLIN
jgi:hypothetical protein